MHHTTLLGLVAAGLLGTIAPVAEAQTANCSAQVVITIPERHGNAAQPTESREAQPAQDAHSCVSGAGTNRSVKLTPWACWPGETSTSTAAPESNS